MTTLRLPVYRTEPRSAKLDLMGGIETTASREIPLILSSTDYGTGFNNIAEMKIWGDLDPGFYPEWFGSSEGNANWQPFAPLKTLVLSAGDGDKTVSAKMRNGTGVESDTLTDTIAMSVNVPETSILWADKNSAPMMDGIVQFGWSSSHAFASAAVCLAPSLYTLYEESSPIQTYTSDSAGAHQWFNMAMTSILTADLHPTQSGEKLLKVFVNVGGAWH